MPGGSSAQGKRSSSRMRALMRCHGEGLNLPAAAGRLGLREMRGRLRRSGPREGAVSTPSCNVWLPHSKSASPERADYVGMSYVYRVGC